MSARQSDSKLVEWEEGKIAFNSRELLDAPSVLDSGKVALETTSSIPASSRPCARHPIRREDAASGVTFYCLLIAGVISGP